MDADTNPMLRKRYHVPVLKKLISITKHKWRMKNFTFFTPSSRLQITVHLHQNSLDRSGGNPQFWIRSKHNANSSQRRMQSRENEIINPQPGGIHYDVREWLGSLSIRSRTTSGRVARLTQRSLGSMNCKNWMMIFRSSWDVFLSNPGNEVVYVLFLYVICRVPVETMEELKTCSVCWFYWCVDWSHPLREPSLKISLFMMRLQASPTSSRKLLTSRKMFLLQYIVEWTSIWWKRRMA